MRSAKIRYLSQWFVMFLTALSSVGAFALSAEAATRTVVLGQVTDESGTPIVGARVSIDVRMGVPGGVIIPPSLRSAGTVVVTDSLGIYRTALTIPDVPTPSTLFLTLSVVKLAGPPIYGTSFGGFTLKQPGAQPQGIIRTKLILPTTTRTTAAFIMGTARDHDTFERLGGITLRFFDPVSGQEVATLTSDADGEYAGVIPLASTTQTLHLSLRSNGIWDGVNGLTYYGQDLNVSLSAGQTMTRNFALEKDNKQSSLVVGRVIDGLTGRPIPNALVRLEETVFAYAGLHPSQFQINRYAQTDTFGRYQVSVDTAIVDHIIARAVISTGGVLPCADAKGSSNACQIVDLSGRLRYGDVYEQDFTLVPGL